MPKNFENLKKSALIHAMLNDNPDLTAWDIYYAFERQGIKVTYEYIMMVKKGFNQRRTLEQYKLL